MQLKFIICNMDLALKGKIIIVTGGSKGIGKGIVSLLIEEDAIPVIIGRNKKSIMTDTTPELNPSPSSMSPVA